MTRNIVILLLLILGGKIFSQTKIIASAVSPGYSSTNATAAFVNAIKSGIAGDTIVIDYPDGSDGVWNIEGRYPNYFDGNSGTDLVANDLVVIFEPGVTLKAIDATFDDNLDMLFRLEDVDGWHIIGYGATFEMDRSVYTTGESRHSMALYDCRNITIEGLTIDGSGGDGLYIGSRTSSGYTENIIVDNCIFKNHRRQGLSIASGKNLLFENVKFNGTLGTPPMSGIDLEPNYSTQLLDHIKFKNVELANNGYTGLTFSIANFNNTTTPINVTFDGLYVHDNWADTGIWDTSYKRTAINTGMGGGATTAIKGSQLYNNVYIKDEKYDGIYTIKHHDSYDLTFNNTAIDNVGNENFASAKWALHTSRFNYDSPTPDIGKVFFNGLLILEDRDVPFWQLEGDSNDGWGIKDIVINDAMIITPNTGDGINNTTGATVGAESSLTFSRQTTIPTTTVNLSTSSVIATRGSSAYFSVTRESSDISFPLPVEYTLSGTATNMDDYDLLHGYVIIPANMSSVNIPISARAKDEGNETVILTLSNTGNYDLGTTTSGTISIVPKLQTDPVPVLRGSWINQNVMFMLN